MQPRLVEIHAAMRHHQLSSLLFHPKGETQDLWQASGRLLFFKQLDLSQNFKLTFESLVIVSKIELLEHGFTSTMLDREPCKHHCLF